MNNKHTFGPINSRRFGISLGIDLSTSHKQCNFDCLYCELDGAKATKQQSKISLVKDILDEIKQSIDKHKNIDVLTISANGEPTMYPHLKELINGIKKIKHKNTKTLILSNASTIINQDIQNILLDIDIVKLSLDSVDERVFRKIDRPHKDIKIKDIINGILEFKKIFKNELAIEILFVKNINDKKEHIREINNILLKIKPNRVDISTIDRPPAYNVEAIDDKSLFEIASYFDKSLNVSVAYSKKTDIKAIDFSKNEILEMLKRRPQNKEDINNLFSKKSKLNLEDLIKKNEVKIKMRDKDTFFVYEHKIK